MTRLYQWLRQRAILFRIFSCYDTMRITVWVEVRIEENDGGTGSFAHVPYVPPVKTFVLSEFLNSLQGSSTDGHGFVFKNASAHIRALEAGDLLFVKGELAVKVLGSITHDDSIADVVQGGEIKIDAPVRFNGPLAVTRYLTIIVSCVDCVSAPVVKTIGNWTVAWAVDLTAHVHEQGVFPWPMGLGEVRRPVRYTFDEWAALAIESSSGSRGLPAFLPERAPAQVETLGVTCAPEWPHYVLKRLLEDGQTAPSWLSSREQCA